MDRLVVLELVGLGLLLLCSALLTGAEAAFFSLGRARLKELAHEEGQEPGSLTHLLQQPHELLVTLLVGITLVNIGASALAASVAGKLFGSWGLAVAIGAMIFLLTVFGEVLPMTLAVEHPRRFSAWVSRPVGWLSVLLAPIRVGSAFELDADQVAASPVDREGDVACGLVLQLEIHGERAFDDDILGQLGHFLLIGLVLFHDDEVHEHVFSRRCLVHVTHGPFHRDGRVGSVKQIGRSDAGEDSDFPFGNSEWPA